MNPDTLLPWTDQNSNRHNVRVLCDLAGLSIEEKDTITACIYQESEYYNYLPNGSPVRCQNHDSRGNLLSSDWGICQVNDHYHIGEGKDFSSVDYVLDNPKEVVDWMIEKYKQGELSQWVSFSSGAYKKWLPFVEQEVPESGHY